MRILHEMIKHFKPYWKSLILVLIFTLLSGFIAVVPPMLTGGIVQKVLIEHQKSLFPILIGGILISFVLKSVFDSLQEFIQVKAGMAVISDIQMRAFKKIQKTPMSFFSKTPRGDILYRLTIDVEAIQNVNNSVIPRLIQQIISASFAMVTLLSIFWQTGLVMFAIFIVFIIPSYYLSKYVKNLWAIHRDMYADMYDHLQESIESTRLIRTFQTQDYELSKMENKLTAWKKFSIKVALINKAVRHMGSLFRISGPGIIMVISAYAVWKNQITLGEATTVLTLLPIMFMPMWSIADNAITFQQAVPALSRIFEYFDLPEEHDENLPTFGKLQGEIILKDIWFRYPDTEEDVLKGVDLVIQPGMHIGIVGTSGGGKSTLIQLVLGIYKTSQGYITIDGKNLDSFNLNSFRKQVGIVSQETFLLNATLKQNLLYGKPDASDEEIFAAVEAAHLTDFVESLSEGYETIVGERGLKLSGGQRQRLAMARALLRKPTLLIFDEATSSLDGETEMKVQESLEELMPGRTTITIAHRLATVRNSDQILLMDQGVIAEQGTHDELMTLKGLYYKLYMSQYSDVEREATV
ncbi:MAG: transporter ATP-binding protein [Bacillales bacterium]|jgi:ATP-binding cassette subfamily B protein/subfamily B ATP-binding cassette protein MsbA|nr:transporter ATP-binding protein [Bacillales bacterium]